MIRDEEEALEPFDEALDDLSSVIFPFSFEIVAENTFLDPILEQPEFVEVRSRLGFRE